MSTARLLAGARRASRTDLARLMVPPSEAADLTESDDVIWLQGDNMMTEGRALPVWDSVEAFSRMIEMMQQRLAAATNLPLTILMGTLP